MADNIANLHPTYTEQQKKRDVFAAVQSTDEIRKGRELYLPKYPAEQGAEYAARLCASTIDGLVAGGVDVLAGSVFYEEIDTEGVNESVKLLFENIDLEGNHFNVVCRDAFKYAFAGFSVIVVDMPNSPANVKSLEDQQRSGLRPYWRCYQAKDVINWRFETDPQTKQKRLKMIVFKEVISVPDGRFSEKALTRYRHWFIDDANRPAWEVWEQAENTMEPSLMDQGSFSDSLQLLPVAFIGDVLDDPWLLTEARLEIKAYQKESSFDVIEYLSIPTFYTKGYEGDGALSLGASAHIKMPIDGDVGYAQIDSKGLAELKLTIDGIKETIKGRVNDMVSVESEAVDETATAAMIKDRDKQSRLIVWADQLKDALERALQFTGQLMGLGEDGAGEIVLRTKWLVTEEQAQARFNADREIMTENGND